MPKTQTERQKLRDDHPDSWIAVNAGDTIMGGIADVTEAWSDQRRDPVTGRQGSLYPLLIVVAQEATGYTELPRELKVHGFGAVLFNEIMRKQPNVGEKIRITYTGPGKAKPGQNAPELYTVRAAAGSESAQRAYDKIGRRAPSGQPVQGELPVDAADFAPREQTDDEDIPF